MRSSTWICILVRRGERITVEIAVQVSGEIVAGGLLDQSLNTLSVTAEATNIPQSVEISIEGLEIGESVHAGRVSLPEGVEIAGDPEQVVVHIVPAPTAEELEAELDVEAAAGEEAGEEAEAAAGDEAGEQAEAAADAEPAQG